MEDLDDELENDVDDELIDDIYQMSWVQGVPKCVLVQLIC